MSCFSQTKRFSIKASIHKTANIKAHIKGTSTSKIKHMSFTAIYNKGINQYTHQPSSESSDSYLQMKSLKLGFRFLTRADFLIGTLGVVEDFTTKDECLLVPHVEVCSATSVVVLPSVVDLAVTRSGATVVGQAKGAIWLVLARIVLSDSSESSLVRHGVIFALPNNLPRGKRHSVSSCTKNYTLSDGIIDDSRESHFPSKQNFWGSLPSREEELRCVNRTGCRNAWKLTQRDEFHALIAFFTVCTARSASPLLLGLSIGLSKVVQPCACNQVTTLLLINFFRIVGN